MRWGLGLALLILLPALAAAAAAGSGPGVSPVPSGSSGKRSVTAGRREGIAPQLADAEESFWKKIATAEPAGNVSTRTFFTYALVLCESRRHPERLERLLRLAAGVQDRNPQSHGYGNFKWSWRDAGVTDGNSVEFCMHDALRIWLVHRKWLPEPARKSLLESMHYSIEGCLRHRVPTNYTNIALLNAANLIGLGEALEQGEPADEGYRRFEAFYLYTWQFGVHEYCSPTYYACDLSGLLFIEGHAARPAAREQARALLQLFWTDITLNWFQPSEKFGGSQSRSYNYLYGLGGVDSQLWLAGWLDGPLPDATHILNTATARWSPPEELYRQGLARYPRLLRQRWGVRATETRTQMMFADVSLGTSAATYGSQDLPLTIDLPGRREEPRCYFIADGRTDPYGKIRYETSAAKHLKALHLAPFWAAAQQRRDALGLVIYRPKDLAGAEVTNLQSHLVLRRGVDGFWLGGRKLPLAVGKPKKPVRTAIAAGAALVLRNKTAAIGIRVLWARRQDGQPASIALVDDGNKFGVVRLTIEHRCEHATAEAGAAFWIRVGSSLADDAAFQAWCRRFDEARPDQAEFSDRQVRIAVAGEDGPLALSAEAPFGQGRVQFQPPPPAGILELDGREIGRGLLAGLEPARSCKVSVQQPIQVPAAAGVAWDAADGLVFPGMRVSQEPSGPPRRFLWQPIMEREAGHPSGYAIWPLEVAQAGRYFLWARTLANDPKTDSFYFQLDDESHELLPKTTWNVPHAPQWQWHCVALDKARSPTPWQLPAGRCYLQIMTREPGTKIDRLFWTTDPHQQPKP